MDTQRPAAVVYNAWEILNASALCRRYPALAAPLVMVTAIGGPILNQRARGLGFVGHTTRPIKYSQLRQVLAAALGNQADAERPPTAPLFDGSLGTRNPLRILLVEDNTINQKVALRILERLGYAADLACDGSEALAAVRRQPYDLLLMDLQMPEMDGLEATRAIRTQIAADQQPTIVAMTAAASREDRQACLDAGMDAYISKPVRIEELTGVLTEVKQVRRSIRLVGEPKRALGD